MRQVINAVVFANVVANLKVRALVAGIVTRFLRHLNKPATGRDWGKSWQTMPSSIPCHAKETSYREGQLRLIPILATSSLPGPRS